MAEFYEGGRHSPIAGAAIRNIVGIASLFRKQPFRAEASEEKGYLDDILKRFNRIGMPMQIMVVSATNIPQRIFSKHLNWIIGIPRS